MAKESKSKYHPNVLAFSDFLRLSGFEGNTPDFARSILNMSRHQLYNALRDGLDEAEKFILVESLKDGKNRDYGIKDAALTLLEKAVDVKIPRGGDSDNIRAKGDNINIKNTTISVGDSDIKDLYREALEKIEELEKENIRLKAKLEAYNTIYGGQKENKEGNQ